MRQKAALPAWTASLALALSVLAAETLLADAKSDFEMLFGAEAKKVSATKSTLDDATFAGKLLEAARALGDSPALQILICERACEFGLKHRGSYAKALEAIELLAGTYPDKAAKQAEWRDKRLKVLALQYSQSYGAARKAAAGLDALLAQGDARAAAGKPGDALELYRKAFPIATFVQSPRTKEIVAKRRQMAEQAAAIEKKQGRLKSLKARLAKDPKDSKAREGLILYYVVELDELAEAAKLLTEDVDERLRTYVPLAAKPIPEVPEAGCLELGGWYKDLAAAAAGDARVRLHLRAKAYLDRFLSVHAKQDVPAYKAKLARKAVEAELAKLGVKAAPAPVTPASVTPAPVTPAAGREWTAGVEEFLKLVVNAKAYGRSHLIGDRDARGQNLDNMANGGLLVGLKVTVGPVAAGKEGVRAVQAIFSDGNTDRRGAGEVFGDPTGKTHTVVAREGYAVGGLMSMGLTRLHALQLVFMRVTDHGLDANDVYKSPWYGDAQRGGRGRGVDSEGRYVIGITGKTSAEMKTLGLMLALPRTRAELAARAAKPDESAIKKTRAHHYEWLDLLSEVNLKRDVQRGSWKKSKGELSIAAGAEEASLLLPTSTRWDYEIRFAFTRHAGRDAVGLRFPVGPTHRSWVRLGEAGTGACGLVFKGRRVEENDTTVKGNLIANGKENRVLVRMMRTAGGGVEINVTLNGKRIISWRGKMSDLEPGKQIAAFVLFTSDSTVTFHSAQFRLLPAKAGTSEK